MKPWISKLSFLLALCAAACDGGETVDIGRDGPLDTLGSQLSDYSGTWSGYAEAYKFLDGSDRLQIVLDGDGQGTIKLGSVAWPAPAPDSPLPGPESGGDQPIRYDRVEAGFAFSVHAADVSDRRIRFSFKNMEAYDEYCAVRVPTAWSHAGQSGHMCAIPSATPTGCAVGGGADAPAVECASMSCMEVCTCSATGCLTMEAENITPGVDAALTEDGASMVGTLVIGETRVTVRLTRS